VLADLPVLEAAAAAKIWPKSPDVSLAGKGKRASETDPLNSPAAALPPREADGAAEGSEAGGSRDVPSGSWAFCGHFDHMPVLIQPCGLGAEVKWRPSWAKAWQLLTTLAPTGSSSKGQVRSVRPEPESVRRRQVGRMTLSNQ
jgi:hypothetical protein